MSEYKLNKKYNQNMQTQTNKIGLGGIIGLIVIISSLYFILLGPDHTIFSLNTLVNWSSTLSKNDQVLIVALLPAYLAILIFGGSFLGLKVGSFLQRYFLTIISKK